MTDIWDFLKNTELPVFLYGMGNGADKILNTLGTLGISVSGVFVSDGFVRDKVYRGFKLQSYSQVKESYEKFIVLLSFGTSLPDVIENVRRISSEQILLAPDMAVFGDGLFTLKYCKDNKNKIEKIYDLLADDVSKNTFEYLVRYKITGDINYLFECERSPKEPFEKFLGLSENDVFVDLGAYRGDTVREFLDNVGGFKKAYAVEPDKKTFEKLKKAVPDNVICVNAAVSDKEGICFFEMQSGRGSHISSNGNQISSVSVDSLLFGEKADYIKMDVEGAENLAIEGARETILKYKPKMCIAAYHRTYDLLELPEKVLSIRDDYKVYLRHFPYLPAWDTNYYFI